MQHVSLVGIICFVSLAGVALGARDYAPKKVVRKDLKKNIRVYTNVNQVDYTNQDIDIKNFKNDQTFINVKNNINKYVKENVHIQKGGKNGKNGKGGGGYRYDHGDDYGTSSHISSARGREGYDEHYGYGSHEYRHHAYGHGHHGYGKPYPKPCTSGVTGVISGDDWVVCQANRTDAWVSADNRGEYNSTKICNFLGYKGVGKNQFGGTSGNVCGIGTGPIPYTSNCTNVGEKFFSGSGASAFPIIRFTVMWECTNKPPFQRGPPAAILSSTSAGIDGSSRTRSDDWP